MEASAPHVAISPENSHLDIVFVPTALALELLDKSTARLVGHTGSTNDQIRWIMQNVDHDVYITANTEIDFAMADSDCLAVEQTSGHFLLLPAFFTNSFMPWDTNHTYKCSLVD